MTESTVANEIGEEFIPKETKSYLLKILVLTFVGFLGKKPLEIPSLL